MFKNEIKKIPFLGPIIVRTYNALKGIPTFRTSDQYWEERYKMGGNSGSGSYNKLAEFKGKVINLFIISNGVESVKEFGCGDGNQLRYFKCKDYVGYDISSTAIDHCKDIFMSDSTKKFKLIGDYNEEEKADLTLSLDVIYHLVEDDIYFNYMALLFSSSLKYVIVYSSNSDEHENNNVASHVKHRRFSDWVDEMASDFKLIKHIPNKYPYDGDGAESSFADFYIYKKES